MSNNKPYSSSKMETNEVKPQSPRYKIPHLRELETSQTSMFEKNNRRNSPRYKVDSPRDKVLVRRLKDLFDELMGSKQLHEIKMKNVNDISMDAFNYLQDILNSSKPANEWENGSYSMFTSFVLADEVEKSKVLEDESRKHLVLWMDFMIILQYLDIEDKAYIRKMNGKKFQYIVSPKKNDIPQVSLEQLMEQLKNIRTEVARLKEKDSSIDFDISRLDLDYLNIEETV